MSADSSDSEIRPAHSRPFSFVTDFNAKPAHYVAYKACRIGIAGSVPEAQMIKAIPLTVLPLAAYNLLGYSLSGADPWAAAFVVVPMPSGALLTLTIGDLLVAFAVAMLYVEVSRFADASRGAIVNRTLSLLVLVAYVAEFLAADAAAHSVFFLLTTIAVFDVVAGFSIRRGRRSAEDYPYEAP